MCKYIGELNEFHKENAIYPEQANGDLKESLQTHNLPLAWLNTYPLFDNHCPRKELVQ
jgi:hypothetical protein